MVRECDRKRINEIAYREKAISKEKKLDRVIQSHNNSDDIPKSSCEFM